MVQQPLDAEAADMPQAALEAVDADRVVRADDMPAALAELVRQRADPAYGNSPRS